MHTQGFVYVLAPSKRNRIFVPFLPNQFGVLKFTKSVNLKLVKWNKWMRNITGGFSAACIQWSRRYEDYRFKIGLLISKRLSMIIANRQILCNRSGKVKQVEFQADGINLRMIQVAKKLRAWTPNGLHFFRANHKMVFEGKDFQLELSSSIWQNNKQEQFCKFQILSWHWNPNVFKF